MYQLLKKYRTYILLLNNIKHSKGKLEAEMSTVLLKD